MNNFPIDDQLVLLIDRLNYAINVSNEAIDIKDQGYPFATGYSRSAMAEVADDLSKIVRKIRNEVDCNDV
jgi:hypothetical protein